MKISSEAVDTPDGYELAFGVDFHVSAVSDVGAVRARNEDCFGYSPRSSGTGVFSREVVRGDVLIGVVADGLGGHVGGDVASKLAVDTVLAFAPLTPDGLVASIELADTVLLDEMTRRPELDGMGTTIAAVMITAECVTVANVGDSMAFGFWDGRLFLLSHDDGIGSTGLPGVPTGGTSQALGVRKDSHVRVHRHDSPTVGDLRVLLCTDGLTSYVTAPVIGDVLRSCKGGVAVERLLQLVRSAGAPDNVTILLIEPAEPR